MLRAYYIDLVQGGRKGALEALFCFFLLLFSFIYGFFVKLILFCYKLKLFKSTRPDCRIISVGNITWGGTGKTPLVEALARFFKQAGRNPAILIRGYGKDEVDMLKDKFRDIPVLAGRNRINSARIARERYGADIIILDDGFQHWRVARDIDIVLVDAANPFGNRKLIPRGILREPLSALARADLFVITRVDCARGDAEAARDELKMRNACAPIFEAVYWPHFLHSLTSGKKVELSAIKGERIGLIAGIARPESFIKTAKSLGAEISLSFVFPDHHQYSEKELESIESQCLKQQIETLVTTEKDAPKLVPLLKSGKLRLEILALSIEFKIINNEEKFFRSLLGASPGRKPYSILVLSDGKAGHLNQAKAVAGIVHKRKIDQGRESGQIETKIVEVKFKNAFCRILLGLCSVFSAANCRSCLACLRFCLQKGSFNRLMKASTDIIVSAGASLSPVNLLLSYKNKARNIILMKPPFLSLARFDLAIIPEHDRIYPLNNVLLTRITPNLIDSQYLKEQANILRNRNQIAVPGSQNDGPTIGVLIGGDTPKYKLTSELMDKVVSQLKQAAENLNCRILVSTSRRTPKAAEELLRENLDNFSRCKLLVIASENNIPEAVGGILGLSDIIVVSGESISMVSEAVSAEKYVLVFKPEKNTKAMTKQEEFLRRLEKEGALKIIPPDSLLVEIERTWREKPYRKKIEDRERIYQAISRIV